jgi:hypothetical protein
MRIPFLLLLIALSAFSSAAQTKPVRTGTHSFTIQWIRFNNVKPGSVNIKLVGKGKYSIAGQQRDAENNDFVRIDGTFTASGRNLYFNGTILSQITGINGGEPCRRTGPQIFKASGQRQYWRLQQMLNCDATTTDYIDIFF